MFASELHHNGHVKRFIVQERGIQGWEAREEQDDEILRRVCYTDWHRVERAVSVFKLRIGQLEDNGWSTAAVAR